MYVVIMKLSEEDANKLERMVAEGWASDMEKFTFEHMHHMTDEALQTVVKDWID